MKTNGEMLNDITDTRFTWSDVTNNSLNDIYKSMGYEISQLPDGSWGYIKTSVESAEKNAAGVPFAEPLNPVQEEPLTQQIVNVSENTTPSIPTPSATLGAMSKIDKVVTAAANPIALATYIATAAYMGLRIEQSKTSEDPEFWDETLRVIFGEPMPQYLMRTGAWLPQAKVEQMYDSVADIVEQIDKGNPIYYDEQGNRDGFRYANQLEFDGNFEDSGSSGFRWHSHIVWTVTGGALFKMARKHGSYFDEVSAVVVGDSTTPKTYTMNIVAYGTRTNKTSGVTETFNWSTTKTLGTYGSDNFIYLDGQKRYISSEIYRLSIDTDGIAQHIGFPRTSNPTDWSYYPWPDVYDPGSIYSWRSDTNLISKPVLPGVEKIPGAVYPDKNVPFATRYPTWYNNRFASNATFSTKDEAKNQPGVAPSTYYLPVQPLSPDYIQDLTAPLIDSLHDLSLSLENLPDTAIHPEVKIDVQTQEEQQTKTRIDEGVNPYIPTPVPTGTTNPPDAAVPLGGGENTGFVQIYHPSRSVVASFSQWLWSTGFNLDNFKKLFQDPMSAIISLHMIYATPTDAGTDSIKVGYIDSGVSSSYITDTVISIECGSLSIPEYYGNALDYDPHTEILIYLPFIGFKSLSANDVIGNEIKLVYNIDVITGVCIAMIYVDKDGSKAILYTFEGNCCVQVPITSSNFSSILSGVIGTIASIGATIATGGAAAPLAITAGAGLVTGSRVGIERSGSLGGNGGALAPKIPYIVIKRPVSKVAYDYNKYMGYPASSLVKLSRCTGFTRVRDVIIDDVKATSLEKNTLRSLLTSGIIL